MLIHALENCETLLKLNMEWNSACDAVMELEEVLQDGVLQEIDLSNNEIGEKRFENRTFRTFVGKCVCKRN